MKADALPLCSSCGSASARPSHGPLRDTLGARHRHALFHLLLKQPLIALISPRLGVFTPAGLPVLPWHAVIASLVVGALTHIGWNELTHSHDDGTSLSWLQHASTAFGTAVLAW